MFKRTLFFVLCLLLANSCIVKKKTTYGKKDQPKITVEATKPTLDTIPTKPKPLRNKSTKKADAIITTALTFSGVKYKFGGNTKKGIDCSGLLYVSFKKHDISIPRVSYLMAQEGRKIKIKNVNKGDFLFFKTSRKGKKINHVGMVVAVGKEVKFIHATSSRGVIVSSLREGYWNHAFVKATRIL